MWKSQLASFQKFDRHVNEFAPQIFGDILAQVVVSRSARDPAEVILEQEMYGKQVG